MRLDYILSEKKEHDGCIAAPVSPGRPLTPRNRAEPCLFPLSRPFPTGTASHRAPRAHGRPALPRATAAPRPRLRGLPPAAAAAGHPSPRPPAAAAPPQQEVSAPGGTAAGAGRGRSPGPPSPAPGGRRPPSSGARAAVTRPRLTPPPPQVRGGYLRYRFPAVGRCQGGGRAAAGARGAPFPQVGAVPSGELALF